MGEKQETDQRSPNTAKRPSPTSVKELLDIVHLQQATVPVNVAVKQDAEVLSSRGGFNPLPAIGKSASSSPPTRSNSPPPQGLRTSEDFIRARANSDGYQYNVSRPIGLSSNTENGSVIPSIHAPRDGPHHPVPSTPAGRPTQQRRERTLPPLSELTPEEKSLDRQKRHEVSQIKTQLRRTASGDGQVRVRSVDNSGNQGRPEERIQRPKSSHGRRRPLPSEIIAIHNSTPAPYDDGEVFAPNDTRRSKDSAEPLSPRDPPKPHNQAPMSRQRLERPKSSKGRTRRKVRTTGSLSQGDDWSSDEDVRPRAPSPPSPGLDSDLDSGNEGYSINNGRSVRPR